MIGAVGRIGTWLVRLQAEQQSGNLPFLLAQKHDRVDLARQVQARTVETFLEAVGLTLPAQASTGPQDVPYSEVDLQALVQSFVGWNLHGTIVR